MAITAVHQAFSNAVKAAVSSETGTYINSTSIGNALVVLVSVNGAHITSAWTMSDSVGNTFTQIGTNAGAGAGTWAVFVAPITFAATGASSTYTANFAGQSITAYSVQAWEFSGLGSTLDGTVQAGASGAALSLTPALSTDLAIGIGVANTSSATNFALATGFTTAGQSASTGAGSSTNVDASMQYKILSSTSAVSFNPTATTAGVIGLLLLKATVASLPPGQFHARHRAATARAASRGRF